jgi:cytoplasmic iron level regulating protein YaaA (DUF328/UPF0246 family)
MLILLPPSETKRTGGDDPQLSVAGLRFPRLAALRGDLVRDVALLAQDSEASMRALKLGPRLANEVGRNLEVADSPTMPALDRYTGVLYDALESASLAEADRCFAGEHLVIHSALFGPVSALDGIPAYRLSHDSRVPGIQLKRYWSTAVTRELSGSGLILDLRSEGYVALGPVAGNPQAYFLRVVTIGPDGTSRALNHFNKSAKGLLTRQLLMNGQDFASVHDLLAWAVKAGIGLTLGGPGELVLVVSGH